MNVTLNNVNPGATPAGNIVLSAATENILPNEAFVTNAPQFINQFPVGNQPILLQQQQQQQQLQIINNVINLPLNEQEIENQASSNLQFMNDLKPAPNSQFQITGISRPQQITPAAPASSTVNKDKESRFRIVKTDAERKTDVVSQSTTQPIPAPSNPSTTINNLPSNVTNTNINPALSQQTTLMGRGVGGGVVSQQASGNTLGTSYNRGRWKVVDYEASISAIEQPSVSIQAINPIKSTQAAFPTIPGKFFNKNFFKYHRYQNLTLL